MSAKIYVHSYVDGPDPDDRRKSCTGRLSWRALPGVLRQALVRLHPGIQRHCPLLFAVELVTIAFLVVTLAGLWGWIGAAVLSSVVVIDIHLLVVLLAGNLVLALGEWQRQQRAVPRRKALPRLAYRVTNYRDQAVMVRVRGAADGIEGRSRACEIAAIDARDLQAGDVIVVDAGQLIPADGDILEALRSSMRQSSRENPASCSVRRKARRRSCATPASSPATFSSRWPAGSATPWIGCPDVLRGMGNE